MNSVDKCKSFKAFPTDLSMAIDYLYHELLTTKVNAYEFNLPTLRLVRDYLNETENNEQKLMMIIVFGRKYCLALYEGQF